jgi:hypothetical protein
MEPIFVAARFRGPPMSGNGGYVAGSLARSIEGPAAVRLHLPPPLGVPMKVSQEEGAVALWLGDTLVARAAPVALDLEPPPSPGTAAAETAARAFRGFEDHVFPGCFVCGTERKPGDGLCIFTGPVDGSDLVAAPWIPDASLDAGDGTLAPEFVWAALDCPGAFAFPQPEGRAVVLGELAVRRHREVRVGERCVVVAWSLGDEGRKHFAGSALYDESGACCAVARAVWIEIERS